MEGQQADGVGVQVEPRRTWRDALAARMRPSDHHVSDEDVFAILNGGGDGVTTPELCAAKGVTLPMYCVWKRKYQRLTLDQLRDARRGERRRRQSVIGVAVAAAAIATGGIAISAARAVFAAIDVAPEPLAERTAAPVEREPLPPPPRIPEPPRVQPARSSAAAAPRRQSAADGTPAIAETGYRIQVTAADDRDEGLAMVAQLASAGYPAYITKAVVGSSEVFRVRIGPFETLAAAEETASRLRSAGYDGAWIAR